METTSSKRIAGSPLLTQYDFRASSFYDGYMSMCVMADRIASDIRFEKKLKNLHEERIARESKNA